MISLNTGSSGLRRTIRQHPERVNCHSICCITHPGLNGAIKRGSGNFEDLAYPRIIRRSPVAPIASVPAVCNASLTLPCTALGRRETSAQFLLSLEPSPIQHAVPPLFWLLTISSSVLGLAYTSIVSKLMSVTSIDTLILR